MNTHTQNLIDRVTKKIASGDVRMRSRALFVLRGIGVVMLALLVFLTSTIIANFIFFSIHATSSDALLGFGPRGWVAFVRFFPWGLLCIDIGSIVLLANLLRSFRTGYRIPLLYLSAALIVGAIALGATIERHTPVNTFLDREMGRPHMPMHIGGMWNRMHVPPPPMDGVCHCEIVSISNAEHMIVRDLFTGEQFMAVVSEVSHATTTGLSVGDRVYIAGDVEDDTFIVFGLKREGEGRRWSVNEE